LRVAGVVGQEIQPLPFHGAAAPAPYATNLQVQVDAVVGHRQIADPSPGAIVPSAMSRAAASADGFFERRTSVTTRAFGSPKTPCTVSKGRNPGKAYASDRRRRLRDRAIAQSCQKFRSEEHTSELQSRENL